MTPILSFFGYRQHDPLDDAPAATRYLLVMGSTAVLSLLLLYLAFDVLHIATLKYAWLFWLELAVLTLFYAPVVCALRKSSSLVHIALLMAGGVPVDLFLEARYRSLGHEAPWMYSPDGLLGPVHPLLRIVIVWFGDALICGPIALWVARMVARAAFHKQPEAVSDLFPDEWCLEQVDKPHHDAAYYILRLIGLAYLSYFLLAILGLPGTAPWPKAIRDLLDMTYANPALTINTFIKLTIIFVLATLGAHNVKLRWHCSLILLVGHLVSTAASLFFYHCTPRVPGNDFLLTSAIVDGVISALLVWVMIRYRGDSHEFARPKEFSEFYSLPQRATTIFYYAFGMIVGLIVPGVLFLRFHVDGSSGWGAVYGYPDPQICNTLTKYSTLSFLSFVVARREALRENLYKAILWPYTISVVASALWLLIGGMFFNVALRTWTGGLAHVDWYYMVNVAIDGCVVLLFLGLRKMVYDVDYSISAMSPSSVQNVAALDDAFYGGDPEDHSATAQSVDKHVGGIRGRKRGLLNVPYWVVEHVLPMLYGLHIGFSSMDREHQRSFLRRSVLRPPRERAKSFIPELAELVYKLGTAAHALTTLAHFSQIKNAAAAGYVPADARDRLQGDYPSARPPFAHAATLPSGPDDRLNNKPDVALPGRPLIAPRVSTPVGEPPVPDEVDYLIVGSGAGGATMANRLAGHSSSVLVIERGPRYSAIQDFNDNELEMIRKLYKEGGLQQTKRFDLTILQGECVGGSTVINNAICFRMPEPVQKKWTGDFGLDLSGLNEEYDRVAGELEIGTLDPIAVNTRVEAAFRAGVAGYNAAMPNGALAGPDILLGNFRNELGTGLANLGDRHVRKRSMLETYVPWAEAHGATTIGNLSAVRFVAQNRRATGLMVRTSLGALKTIRVRKAVIVSGGVIASSNFLMRSGLRKNVGLRTSCNFAFPLAFDFAEEMRAYDGVQITLGATDPQNRAVFETYFNPPGSFALSLPFYFERRYSAMSRYPNLVNFGGLVGAESNGVVERTPDILSGRAFTWELGDRDRANIKYALATLVEIGRQAGATRAFLPTEPGIELPLDGPSVDRFRTALAGFPLTMSSLRLTTAHPQGGNGMYGDGSALKELRVVDGDYRLDGFDNVFVADASIFPSTITVNPQWTIMAMSSLAAKSVLRNTL